MSYTRQVELNQLLQESQEQARAAHTDEGWNHAFLLTLQALNLILDKLSDAMDVIYAAQLEEQRPSSTLLHWHQEMYGSAERSNQTDERAEVLPARWHD